MPVKLHRRWFPSVRNMRVTRKPVHFFSTYFMKNTIYLRNIEIKKFSIRGIREWVPWGSEFCRHCENPSALSLNTNLVLVESMAWPYGFTLGAVEGEGICFGSTIFSYGPVMTYCKTSMKYVQRNVAGNLRCIRKPLSVIFIKGF